MYDLSEFEKFVLSELLHRISDNKEFNLFDQIRALVVHKDVSSFPEKLVSETCEHIDNYLRDSGVLNEIKERRIYFLTEKGREMLNSKAVLTTNFILPED